MDVISSSVRPRPPRRLRRAVLGGVGALVTVAAFGTGAAYAYWAYTDSSNAFTAGAAADALPQGATPATPTTILGTSTVNLSFTQAATSTGHVALTSYLVTRYPAAGGSGTVDAATCSISSGTVSCQDLNVPSGSWVYTNTPRISGTNWAGAESAKSPSVTVDSTTPSPTAPEVTASVNYGTSPIWFDHETLTVSDAPTDVGGTGVASVAYYYCSTSVGACTSSHWTQIGSLSTTGPSYQVTWTALPADGTYNVVAVATGNDSNVSAPSTATEVGVDSTGPVVSAPTVSAAVTYGSNPTFVSNETLTLKDTSSDAGSGVSSVSYYYCAGATGSCTSSNGTALGSSSTASGSYSVTWNTPLPADGTYRIVAVGTDNVTNSTTSALTLITVDATPPTVSTPSVNGFS